MRTRIKLPADPYSENLPRRSRLRGPLIVGGVIVALFAVIALVNQGSKGGCSPSTAATTTPGDRRAPRRAVSPTSITTSYDAGQAAGTADGVPVGYPHSSYGAQAAAANYVVAFNSADMVRSSAAPGWSTRSPTRP